MKQEMLVRLQAYFDGESSQREAREMEDLLAKDTEARALLAELQNTREALRGFEAQIKLPESREFYWSKVAREIERPETVRTSGSFASLFGLLRRLLVPASALATLAIAGILAVGHLNGVNPPEMELALADSDAFTYRDYSSGTTLVWLSYPAENEFGDLESDGIID